MFQLTKEGEEVIDYFYAHQVPIGIWSSFAYQYAINFIASSKLRDKIDPSLIGLSHKKAWEEIFGDGPYQIHDKDYDKNAEFDFLCINDASKILARENGIRNSN